MKNIKGDKNLNENISNEDDMIIEDGDLSQEDDCIVQGSEIEVLRMNNQELSDKLQRTLAEFDNFRKRTMKEKASMIDFGVINTIEKLLPVFDNFERALTSAPDKNDNVYKGIEMIYNQFMSILKDMDVEQINAVGEEFDHSIHNAVSHEENDNYGSSIVMEELAKGYKYKDKVIRHAMVKVAN